jgi:hypothetical protein
MIEHVGMEVTFQLAKKLAELIIKISSAKNISNT